MRKLLLLLSLLSPFNSHAYIICKAKCTGLTPTVIDIDETKYANEYTKFKTGCESKGGVSIQSSQDIYGFDKLNCWKMDYISYCVVYAPQKSEGSGMTLIDKSFGGIFVASSDARDSCQLKLAGANCGKAVAAKNISFDVECQDIDSL